MTIYFDIETGPLPKAELDRLMPEFDEAEVKCGNLKDLEKIAAKIEEARASHRQNFIDGAALSAITGRVLAIGMICEEFIDCECKDGFRVLGHDEEEELLVEFWEHAGEVPYIAQMVGFNSNYFDLPFLIRRSWKLGVPVPVGIRRGRYWADEMVDLMDIWQMGNPQSRASLDAIARHLGCGQKNGDGAEFAGLWTSDRAAAIAYLRNDLEMTVRVARKLGVDAKPLKPAVEDDLP